MTLTLTVIDDQYASNGGDGVKSLRLTGSFTNPYTAGGESVTLSSYFHATAGSTSKFLGGRVMAVNPSVSIDLAGVLATGVFRGDTSSTTTAVLQLFNAGLGGTSKAGLFVDNTTANLSTGTVTLLVQGY